MGPLLGTVLDEDLLLRVTSETTVPLTTRLSNRADEAAVHTVGERTAHLSLDGREAMLRKGLLGML